MRLAVRRAAANSGLEAARVLEALASAMRLAETRVAYTPLGAALLLTLPPARGTPLNSRMPPKPYSSAHPTTAVTHPLSVLNDPLVHNKHPAHDGGSARAGQTLGSASPAKMVKSAWAGDARWVCRRG